MIKTFEILALVMMVVFLIIQILISKSNFNKSDAWQMYVVLTAMGIIIIVLEILAIITKLPFGDQIFSNVIIILLFIFNIWNIIRYIKTL